MRIDVRTQKRRVELAAIAVIASCLSGGNVRSDDSSAVPRREEALPSWKTAARFADLALACVHREYPNKIAHVLSNDADVKPPRELTPVFFGCFDWHSAVHGHWLLARLARTYPDAPFAARARKALDASFRADKVAVELEYLRGEGRRSSERPYGLAWLLQLGAELREWKDDDAQRWSRNLEPLEDEAAQRLIEWFPKLTYPIRTGEHSQTAFAMGLVLDWCRTKPHAELGALVEQRARDYYGGDRGWNLAFEPGGQDFLSPAFAEADLMRRVLEPDAFAAWLGRFLPGIPRDGSTGWLPPAIVTDRADGKLAHLDGLNLSRAWMLDGTVSGLPAGDTRIASLRAVAKEHRAAGLSAVTGEHYEGGHWLGSFAVYLVTRRGIVDRPRGGE